MVIRSRVLVVAFALACTALPHATPRDKAVEVRALWVTRSALASPLAITRMVQAAHANGFNTLLV